MWNDGPRTWKWAVPSVFGIVLFLWGVRIVGDPATSEGFRFFGVCILCVGVLLLFVGGENLWERHSEHRARIFREKKEADAITPRSVILHEAKGVHPEVLTMVLQQQARRWGLVSGTKSPNGEPYAVLMSRPRVTQVFLVYFLLNSNEQTYMPKRMLSDNDHSFDPTKVTTAYEMYDDLESLLVDEMKATRPLGANKPGYWLGEWDPFSVGKDFGININEWESPEEEKSREQGSASRSNGSGSSSNNDLHASSLRDLQQTQAMKMKKDLSAK